jgi:predicted SAM-dependent methyltransferase
VIQNIIAKGQRMAVSLGYDVRRVISARRERELYRRLYPAKDLEQRAFVNIGAGGFRHPFWTNVDHSSDWYAAQQSSGQIEWDIMSMDACPVETNSINIAYTSHTIEHVTDAAVLHMFSEVFRMLKPDGVFRVTAPDAEVLYDAYVRGDELFIENEHGNDALDKTDVSIEERLVYCFASQRVRFHTEAQSDRLLDTETIRHMLSSLSLSEALNRIVTGCSYDMQKRHPGNHINWWNHDKAFRFMEQVGFREIRKSAYGQSRCAVLRNTAHFDNTRPRISFYIEALK